MTDTSTPTRIELDPDGVPVTLVDITGDELYGTLMGAVRAAGAVALVVVEARTVAEQIEPAPVTQAQALALADALTDDPENPHLIEDTRLWWREEAIRLRGQADYERMRAEEAVEIAQGLRAALDTERRQTHELIDAAQHGTEAPRGPVGDALHNARGRAEAAEAALAELRAHLDEETARADRAEQARPGALQLLRAAAQHEQQTQHRHDLTRLRRQYRGKAIAAAAVGCLAGLAIGGRR